MSVLPNIQGTTERSTGPELVYQAAEGGVTEHVVRYRVPGGWCYRTVLVIDDRQAGPSVSTCFVPDADVDDARQCPSRREMANVLEKKLARARSRGEANTTK